MPSRFHDLLTEYLDPFVDQLYAEPIRILPMKRSPNGRPVVDPDREIVEAVGVLDEVPELTGIAHGNRSVSHRVNDLRSQIAGAKFQLTVQSHYVAAPGKSVRQGDHVEVGPRRFDIVSVQASDVTRVNLALVEVPTTAWEGST